VERRTESEMSVKTGTVHGTGRSVRDDNIAKTLDDGVVILGTLFHAGVSAKEVSQHWTEIAVADAEVSSVVYHTRSEKDTFVCAVKSILVGPASSADSRNEYLALTAAVTLQRKAASLSHAVRPKKGHLVQLCDAVDPFAYVEEDDFLYTVLYRYALPVWGNGGCEEERCAASPKWVPLTTRCSRCEW
jgi:hypothetical protein